MHGRVHQLPVDALVRQFRQGLEDEGLDGRSGLPGGILQAAGEQGVPDIGGKPRAVAEGAAQPGIDQGLVKGRGRISQQHLFQHIQGHDRESIIDIGRQPGHADLVFPGRVLFPGNGIGV